MSTTQQKRAYQSPARQAQARATRERVLSAASECFGERGYVATTMQEIATRAGVAVETVYGQGSKRELLLASFDRELSGEEGRTPSDILGQLSRSPDLTTPGDLLAAGVSETLESHRRAYRLGRAFRNAADADPEIAAAHEVLLEGRRRNLLAVAAWLRAIAPGSAKSDAELADEVGFIVSPEAYENFVIRGGWSDERYSEWMLRSLRFALEA